ncbi:MAG: TetR/AcrR family transcriptional regulator [Pseudonocardiaceae bacterium]
MTETRRPRAPAMTPHERRAAIVAATLPLLAEYGATVTTGQIAAASGVAEGTVFRAFTDKQELLGACLQAAFDPADPIAAVRDIPRELPVAQRLLRASTAVAEHWDRAMRVAHAVRASCLDSPAGPATARHSGSGHTGLVDPGEKMRALSAALADLLAPDAANLRLSPERTAQIYLLAVSSDRMLRSRMAALGAADPGGVEELIDVFLHGALRAEQG